MYTRAHTHTARQVLGCELSLRGPDETLGGPEDPHGPSRWIQMDCTILYNSRILILYNLRILICVVKR